uniref:Uncharacterized protein n=1 Tax=Kapraunia schneideri TaxID=717899 RepID=A0A1Z1MSP4_9FLOR|nr:hypothetical protein [Kapraunia schneideri]ARW68899.1 hypothetical protein [Kapraunia schneideri]
MYMSNYIFLKSFLPFVYLIFIQYQYTKSLVILLIFITTHKHRNIYINKLIQNIEYNIIFYSLTFISIFYIDNSYYKVNVILKQSIVIPFLIKYNRKKVGYLFIIYFINYKIPQYIIKVIILSIINLVLTNNLLLFTQNEILLNNAYILLKNNKKSHKRYYKIFLINLLTSYVITEIILSTCYNLYIGLKSKNKLSFKNNLEYIRYCFSNIFRQILSNIYILITTMWNRS